jgi:hypothetical protein
MEENKNEVYLKKLPTEPDLLEKCVDVISSGGSIIIDGKTYNSNSFPKPAGHVMENHPTTAEFAALVKPETPKGELARAKSYLKISGLTCVPDWLVSHLGLSQTGATLGRKFRAASSEDPTDTTHELRKSYYINSKGRRIAQYAHNPNYQEAK